jgi:hypothetical protein
MKELDAKYGKLGTRNAILTNKANSISAPRPGKTAHLSGRFRVKSFVSHKTTAHDERFGFERRGFRYRSRPQGILQPTSKIQHPTSALTSALDLRLWSYVIVVSIQYEASIQSFFLRVRKEGVW